MTEFVYRSEFGSTQPIRFAQCKAYDEDGNEIITPNCEQCGCAMSEVIGKQASIWLCTICPN